MSGFEALVAARAPILTDGGIETRVMFETAYQMDPNVQVAAMVGDPSGREILRSIYGGYLELAKQFDLPVVIGTPTFRASTNYARRAGRDVAALNADAVELQRETREASGHEPVFIAGVLGPSGDAYTPGAAESAADAATYHGEQALSLVRAGADFLFAATFPAVDEALGVAQAMSETGLPYVVSYVLDHDGRVLDETPLAEAVRAIDERVDPRPLMHSISCVHPSVAKRAVAALREDGSAAVARVGELKANGSPLPTEQLIKLDHPEADEPQLFATEIWELFDPHGLHVLGGCCGTTDEHMRALAERMAGETG